MAGVVDRKLKLQETRPGLLIGRLRRGRAAWKAKCQSAKDQLQAQRVRIRDLEQSRDQWREAAARARAEQRNLEQELEQLRPLLAQREADAQKKSPGN